MMWLLLSALAVLENESSVKKHSAEGLYSAVKISMHAIWVKENEAQVDAAWQMVEISKHGMIGR